MEPWRQEIIDYQIKTYVPTNEKYRNSDPIRISVNSQDSYTVPQDSSIHVRGECRRKRNTGVADDAAATDFVLVNNHIAHMFSRVTYSVNKVEVDTMSSLGVTSTVKTYLTNTADETVGLATAGWSKVNWNAEDNTFCAVVPLSMISGFASDFKDVMVRIPQELKLTRSGTDKDAVHCTTAANANNDEIQIKITSVEWKLPIVRFNFDYEAKILAKVKKNDALRFGFRQWETQEYPTLPVTDRLKWTLPLSNVGLPKFVVLAFQTNRTGNHRADTSLFDNVDLRSFKVTINNRIIPDEDVVEDFTKGQYLNFYRGYVDFMRDYWRGEKLAQPVLSMDNYKDHAIFVIKCVYEEIIKAGPLDVSLMIHANKNFPANTTAYAILINEVRFAYRLLEGTVKRVD